MSATIIDELLITLGFDSKQFDEGQKKVSAGLRVLVKEAAAMFAVFASAREIKHFIEDITDADAAVNRLSKNMGVSAEVITEWSGAAEHMGGSAAGMQSTMQSLSSTITEMQLTGTTAMLPYLRALSVHIADTNGKALPLSDILLQMSDSFSKLDRTQANNIGKMMGIDQSTLNVLLEGRKAVEAMLRRQKELGIVTQDNGEKASKLNSALTDFRLVTTGIGRDLLGFVQPALTAVFTALTDGLVWVKEHKVFMGAFAAVLTAVFLPAIVSATAAVWAFTVALLANPVTWVVAGVLALAAAVALLADDWYTWLNGGKSALGGFWQFFSDGWKNAWKLVIAIFTGSADDIKSAGESLGKWLGDGFASGLDSIKKTWADFKSFLGGKKVSKAVDGVTGGVQAAAKAAQEYVGGRGDVLGNLISRGEGDYSSVNLGAANGYKSAKMDLSKMSLDEVMQGQKDHKFNAVGKYQVIGSTLKDASKALNLNGGDKFTPAMQEKIFNEYLIGIKRKEIADYISGKSNDLNAAVSAMAKEWASVADPKTGKSFYSGTANNKASITAQEAAAALNTARGARSRAAAGGPSTTTSETKIGQIVIHTNATDANGISREIGGALKNNSLSNQADAGVS